MIDLLVSQEMSELQKHIVESKKEKKAIANEDSMFRMVQPDEAIMFRQLRDEKAIAGDFDLSEDLIQDFIDLKKDNNQQSTFKIYQLTGYTDDIYAEGHLEIQHYDLILTCTLVNRTAKTISNVYLDLLTQGSLKII